MPSEIIKTIRVGSGPIGIYDNGIYTFVANSNSNTVSQILNSTSKVIRTIDVSIKPRRITSNKDSFYVTSITEMTVSQYSVDTGSPLGTIELSTVPRGVFVGNSNLWVAHDKESDITLRRYNTECVLQDMLSSGGETIRGVAGNDIYICAVNNDTGDVCLLNTATNSSTLIPVGKTPRGVAMDSQYTWVAVYGDNKVCQINNAKGGVVGSVSVDAGPSAMAVDDDYVWSANFDSSTISQINKATLQVVSVFDVPSPLGITSKNGYVHVTSSTNNTVTKIQIEPSNIPISNICFPIKTPIQLDQGIFSIENIHPDKHTINNKKIISITKTISNDTYLINFEKNALGSNYPNKKTIVSKEHKILYKGKMIEAYKFVGHFDNVTKIAYHGEVLFNILMENYDKVCVNNLICETLHPDNIIAKLYTSNISDEYKNKLIVMMNDSILKKDFNSYKKIISRI
jgi:YVTN family beta-propeller protein